MFFSDDPMFMALFIIFWIFFVAVAARGLWVHFYVHRQVAQMNKAAIAQMGSVPGPPQNCSYQYNPEGNRCSNDPYAPAHYSSASVPASGYYTDGNRYGDSSNYPSASGIVNGGKGGTYV